MLATLLLNQAILSRLRCEIAKKRKQKHKKIIYYFITFGKGIQAEEYTSGYRNVCSFSLGN